jgi:DNA-binding response OmpR family regulator
VADKILVVDDEREIMNYIVAVLSREGFDMIGTTGAEEALKLANEEKPDLIISDLKMPVMDGVELCWMIRENSKIPMVPFVFLTGYDDEDLQINGFRAGADEYLIKPIKKRELLKIVRSLIARYKKLQQFGVKIDTGITGTTDEISQVEMLQLLSSSNKTGVFTIIERDIVGKIYLRKGKIVNAELSGMKGLDDNIHLPTLQVIMEACRIIDEEGNQ